MEIVWTDLVVVGTLIWLGYMGARIIGRWNLPAVTGFLLVGIAVGPHGLKLLNADLLHKIAFIEPIALGLIVFLIGEELTRKMLARHHWSFWLTASLNIVLPAALVGGAMYLLAPEEPVYIWLLGIIAISGAPATVMAVTSEMKAKGRGCDTLLGSAALDNITTVVLYAIVVPFLMLQLRLHGSASDALMQTARQIGGAIVLGVVAGWLLARLLRKVFEDGELLALGLTNVLLVVAAAELLGVSSLLAPLVAGITVASVEERRDTRERIFRSLRSVEYPVYIIFFALAGAHLELGAVLAGGALMGAYIAARSVGKFIAGFTGSLAGGYGLRESGWFGLGMLPQAGVAVGLALNAAQVFPEVGATVNAIVLAAIIFFEIIGPIATKRAIACVMDVEAEQAPVEGTPACIGRTILMPVSRALTRERLLNSLAAASKDWSYPPSIVLAHVVTPNRAYTEAAALARGEQLLEELASAVREAGYATDTKLVRARSLERAIAELVGEVNADLVVMGSPPVRRVLATSPLRNAYHRVLDAIDVPVLVVPSAPLATDVVPEHHAPPEETGLDQEDFGLEGDDAT